MAQETLERILSDLDTLEHGELCRLSAMVHERLEADADAEEKERQRIAFLEALLRDGLISEIRTRHRPMRTEDPTPLIRVQGKPVSETIIEERR